MDKGIEEIHAFVCGRVQGVSFRYATVQKACSLGLSGWVRNTPDGRVEILAQGDSENVDKLLVWCHEGPALAHVIKVDMMSRKELKDTPSGDFEIIY